nr:hypothetical protein [Ferrimicrobium acidiphilum]
MKKAEKSGINLFLGSPPAGIATAFWNTSNGSFEDFMKTAKRDNAKTLFVDFGLLSKETVEAAKKVAGLEEFCDPLAKNIGKCVNFISAWISESGVAYVYVIETEIWKKATDAFSTAGHAEAAQPPAYT